MTYSRGGTAQVHPMGPAMFCVSLRLKRVRPEGQEEGVEAFSDTCAALSSGIDGGRGEHGRSPTPFVRVGLDTVGIVANSTAIVVLPPKGHILTVQAISLLLLVGADLRIAEEEGGVLVVGVPFGID